MLHRTYHSSNISLTFLFIENIIKQKIDNRKFLEDALSAF